MRSALVNAGRFTCRLRMMRGFRKRAFSAMGWDVLLPRSVSVPSGNEGVSGFVQQAKGEWSISKQKPFSRRRCVKTRPRE
jgi:hypothetical protein